MAGDANRAVLSQERDLSGLRDTDTYMYIKKINWCGLQHSSPPSRHSRGRCTPGRARDTTPVLRSCLTRLGQ